ncbi:MAG: hypothetical protein NT108_01360 [Candidatus Kaiserbacteria bacterium]|nr:hypothetical protein [Candidatus Kaiserbacteria bacterium]
MKSRRPKARSGPGFRKEAGKPIDNGGLKSGGKPDGVRTACLITETAKKFDIPVSVLFVAAVRHDEFLHVSETEATEAAKIFLSNGKGGGAHVLTKSVRALVERIKEEKNPHLFLRGLGVAVPQRSTPLIESPGKSASMSLLAISG